MTARELIVKYRKEKKVSIFSTYNNNKAFCTKEDLSNILIKSEDYLDKEVKSYTRFNHHLFIIVE